MDDFSYTYVLKLADGEFYVGMTDDLTVRLREHRDGLVTATRHRRPVEMVYYEACRSRSAAAAREKQLKTGFGRGYLNRRLSHERS
jgi:putative endonuclease